MTLCSVLVEVSTCLAWTTENKAPDDPLKKSVVWDSMLSSGLLFLTSVEHGGHNRGEAHYQIGDSFCFATLKQFKLHFRKHCSQSIYSLYSLS